MYEASPAGNRRSRRSNVLLAASVEADGVVTPVKLRNLSEDGALIEGDSLPIEGTEVLFRRNDLCVPGRVAWVAKGQAGVEFAYQLEPKVALRYIAPPKVKPAPTAPRTGVRDRKFYV